MSASITERPRTASGATVPAQRRRSRGGTAVAATAGQRSAQRATRGRSRAGWTDQPVSTTRATGAQKAYARREERLRRQAGGPAARGAGRAPFVLLVMGLMLTGLVATLWLSTAAAADSYRLQDARVAARELKAQSERLHREVASMESAPELARRASAQGMVPVQDPARLVVGPDGAVVVVGVPMAATAKAPPVPVQPPAGAGAQPAVGDPAPGDQAAGDQAAGDQAARAETSDDPASGAPPNLPSARAGATDGAASDDTEATGTARAARAGSDGGQRGASSTGTGTEGAGEDGNGAGTSASSGTGSDGESAATTRSNRAGASNSGSDGADSTARSSSGRTGSSAGSGDSTASSRATSTGAAPSATGRARADADAG